MRKTAGLFLIFISVSAGYCQEFKAQASLDEVTADGFFRIELTPAMTCLLAENFGNVRIYDDNDQELPYLFESEARIETIQQFREYQIVSKNHEKDSFTNLILRNPEKTRISNISVLIKNAEVSKTANLSGSDDGKKWYVLNAEFILSNISDTHETAEIKIVDFPLSNYEFYAIRINDKKDRPLNILKAGYYETVTGKGNYHAVPVAHFSQSDSTREKRSYIRLRFDSAQWLDKLTWQISGGPYYLREGSLHEVLTRTNKKGKTEKYLQFLQSININSAGSAETDLPTIKTRELVLVIENQDNPALVFKSMQAYQLKRYLVAWFKKDSRYKLMIGDASLEEPVYDLPFFRNNIPSELSVLNTGALLPIPADEQPAETTFFNNRMIIWTAIVIVISLLGVMSVRLVRETSAVEKSD